MSVFSRIISRWHDHPRRSVGRWYTASMRYLRAQRPPLRQIAPGYAAACGGIIVATLIIALIKTYVHVENLSLIYLVVVIWLALKFGRGPSILASLGAFLAYDFFFVPPVHTFTVDDPAEWIALGALLLTALVIGQLTVEIRARERLAMHAETLRESDRLKNALLGSVTHDLRTPLAAIQAAVGSLTQPEMHLSAADRADLLAAIDTSANRLGRLVDNLLMLSRIEAGVAVPEKDWYAIDDVIATVLDQLDLAGQTKNRKIVVTAADEDVLTLMDHAQIERVMMNLVENALKYSPPESVITIQTRVVGDPSALEVRVVDQGIGIPPEALAMIFDKFYRLQQERPPWSGARPPQGTGLGLAICAAIIREHGGRIWAESSQQMGTTLIFQLPIPQQAPASRLALPLHESLPGASR
jgi:two-component system, OmpR family, sensor histidine kinase KdpD